LFNIETKLFCGIFDLGCILRFILQESFGMNHVAFDSRKIGQGDTFFALKGEKANGEYYLKDVARRGASAAVVSLEYDGPDFGMKLQKVDDVLWELQERARKRLANWHPRVVGITGSVGKTTCKEFLATLLSEKYCVGKPKGSCNSQISLPATILNFSGDEEVLVLEMGMSLPGEMARLVEIAQPDIALVTNVGLSHAGNFENLEAIAHEKMQIFNSSRLKRGFVGEGCPPCEWERFSLDRIEVGEGQVRIDDSPWIPFHLMEPQFLLNFLAAALVARELGLSWDEIASGAAKLSSPPHRFQQFDLRGVTFIDDSYNASAASTKMALNSLPDGRSIFVFGEMRELGPFSEQSHKEVGELAAQRCDVALLLGDECAPIERCMREAGKDVWRFSDRVALAEKMHEVTSAGDVVLVKGANSHRLWELIK